MSSLLSRLSAKSNKTPIEPREIFMGIPNKDARYEYPRDVQTEVWKKWFPIRDKKNCIIKMNTGSGKTVVGLLILQSCLNEGRGPAAYIVPDHYLVSQVCSEAKKLGIKATSNRDDYLYSENKAILVCPIQSLVNGKSVFGMRANGNYPLGSVLIDDVHACLDTITTQYSLKISAYHPLYNDIVSIFSDQWKAYNSLSYTNIIELQDPVKNTIIPFWMWQNSVDKVLKAIKKYNNDEPKNKAILFSLPLLEDILQYCNCVVTAKNLEITPMGISIDKIKSFAAAQRRIFMSATLSDDSVFVSSIGLHTKDFENIVTPDNANDLGDRLILFPRHLNSMITNEQIREKALSTAEKYNVVVIVPSYERATFWDPDEEYTVTKDNIEDAVLQLKSKHVGMSVFVNRYDGIDLPNDACRMLIIDGLPPLRNEYDKYVQSVDPSSSILLREQVQRIEQGIGRGVRSNSDSCCVVLMGDDLVDVLVRNKGIDYFSNATAEQYRLSKDLWDLLKEENNAPTIDDVWELADYSLNREPEWIQMSKERLSSINYDSKPKLDNISIALRNAYEFACSGMYTKSVESINDAINNGVSSSTRGYLLQIKAFYQNFIDQAAAQQTLMSAHKENISVLSPINGIQYQKCINNERQAKNICTYAGQVSSNRNEYCLYWNAISGKMVFDPDADSFENAIETLGKILGFVSTRPDKETNGAGPDNLWAIGNQKYFVIECKSGASAEKISKSYCNQLGGSIRWFENEYGTDYTSTPIMIHKSSTIDVTATPVKDMRVITPDLLEKLKKQVNLFVTAIVQNTNWMDETQIEKLLQQYKLRSKDLIQEYTVSCTSL